MHAVIERFVNNINLHAASLRIHAQSIENMSRTLDDLRRHRFAIKRILGVLNHTTNIVKSRFSDVRIDRLDDVNVESNLNSDDIKQSITLFEEARVLLLDEADKFARSIETQEKHVDQIRSAACAIPDKAILVSNWLNNEISPALSSARKCVEELVAQMHLLPPIDRTILKELNEYNQNEDV